MIILKNRSNGITNRHKCYYITARFIILIIVLLFVFLNPIKAEEKFWTKKKLELSYSNIRINVKSMPLEIRNAPIHPDDTYVTLSNAGPITQEEYFKSSTWMLGISMKKEIKNKFLLGFKINWIIYPNRWLYDNALRNYTNAVGTEQRGTGSASTFVGIEERGIIPFLNLTPEILFETPLGFGNQILLGTSLSYFKLQAINGWDRYNELEVNKRFTLSHFVPITFYLSFKDIITVGAKYINSTKTNIGKQANIKSNNIAVFTTVAFSW